MENSLRKALSFVGNVCPPLYIMFAHVYRPIRTLLRSCDVFGVKPVLYIKDRAKGLSLTLVASLLCYVVAALLISQQFGNFIAQAESSSFTVVPTHNQQLSWKTGRDLNLSISIPVKKIELAQETNIESLQVSLKNQRRTLHLARQYGNEDIWRFDLPLNQTLTLQGWNQTSAHFQQASLSIDCKQKGDIPCSFGVPYTLALEVWTFDQGQVVPTRRQAIFQKMTFNRSENLHIELNAVLSSSDRSSSPFKNLTESIGLRLDQTNAHYQSEGEEVVIRLGRLMHLFTMAPYKSHRCLSNIGNYITTLNILFLLLFIEFNQLNKYVRACTDLYVVKYLDQNDSLVIEKIRPSVWDFLLPVRKALKNCPMVGKLKLKAVQRLKQQTDVEYIIKSVINLEKVLDQHTTNHVNRYLIQTFFQNQIAPPVVPRSLTSPPIILKVGPPVVPRVGPPRIPRTQPPIIPKTTVRSIQWSTASTEESQESGSRMVPPVLAQDPKIKSLVSLPSTVDTDYSSPRVSQVSAASSRDMFQSKKVQDYLRLTDVRAGRSLKQPTAPDSSVKQQILMSSCPKETLSQLTGSAVSMSVPDIQIRAVQPKKESRKQLWRYLVDLSHNLLSRLDFFSYSINFEVKTNESKCRSQVSGLCTIMAVWLALAIMLLDVAAFLNTDSYSSHFQYTMPPEQLLKAKLEVHDMKIFIFAHNITNDLIVDYNNVKNYTSAEALLGGNNSSGGSKLKWPEPIIVDKLPEGTLAQLTKLPFVKHRSDLGKGYWFNLSQNNFTQTGGLNLGFDFEYSHEVSSSIYNGTILQLVVGTQQLNSTSQSFVERFQSYPLEYSFESDFTLIKKSIQLTSLKLAYDTTVLPIKHNHHQYGYTLSTESAQTRQHNDQTKGRKISVQFRMTDQVVEYRQSMIKVDEFIGNVEGVLIFIICWVALIGLYINRKRLHYTIASVFYPDKLGFSWARLFRGMLTHRRVKELESLMGKARKGEQLLRLDNLQQRIRGLERYSQLPYNSEMDRSLSRVYVKEAQKPSGKTVPFRSTTSLVSTLAEIGSSLIRLSSQYPCKKMEATVRQQPQQSSSRCNKVWRSLGCLDMLDQPVKLSFRGRSSYSSGVTQLISVVLLVGMLGMFSFYLRDYFGMGGTSIQQSTQPASMLQIDDRYYQAVQLKLGFRDKAILNSDAGFMDRLLSVAQMNLFVSGSHAQFTWSTDAADNHTNIKFDNALLQGELDSSIIRFELLEKQFPLYDYSVNTDLHGLLRKELLKTELRVCLTNFHFSPNAKHSQRISQALDCTQYFHMPFTLNSHRSTPVDMVQLQDQHYHAGLFHTTSQQAMYSYRPTEELSYSRKDQDHWNFTYEYRFSGMAVQYQLTPSNLNALANKLIGALALFVCLLLFLTSVNKTRFMLELGCSLYQNQVGAVTFMDAFLVILLRALPVSCRCKLSDRTKQLLFLYDKASQHLSIKLLMHKINKLETGIFRGMSEQQRQQLTLPVRQEVTHQPTLNPEQHRTHNQLKRHLKSSKVYTRLSVDVGLSDSDILAILPALAQPHRLSTTSAKRKLHQLQLQLQ